MTDKELADFLVRRWEGMDVIYAKETLPELNRPMPTVTLYSDQLKKFNDHYKELSAFAAQVCGVDVDKLCLMDMYRFLANREGLTLSQALGMGDVE